MWNEDTQPCQWERGGGQQRPGFTDLPPLCQTSRVLVKSELDVGGDTLAWSRYSLNTRMASC